MQRMQGDKTMTTIEDVDELTNEVMGIIRDKFNIDTDSDQDDELYGQIHNIIKSNIFE
jgi:hypothetical protein